MIAVETQATGTGDFARGIHPPDRKEFAADVAIEVLPTPAQVMISLLWYGRHSPVLILNYRYGL